MLLSSAQAIPSWVGFVKKISTLVKDEEIGSPLAAVFKSNCFFFDASFILILVIDSLFLEDEKDGSFLPSAFLSNSFLFDDFFFLILAFGSSSEEDEYETFLRSRTVFFWG